MVKAWVCPRCLSDLDTFYVEEGDTMVSCERIECPNCGFVLEGAVGECCGEAENDELPAGGSHCDG